MEKVCPGGINLEFEPMSGLVSSAPNPAPAYQLVLTSPKVKVCATAAWFGPVYQGPKDGR